jgi:hypothetical protein
MILFAGGHCLQIEGTQARTRKCRNVPSAIRRDAAKESEVFHRQQVRVLPKVKT